MLVRDILPLLKYDLYMICNYDDDADEYISIFEGRFPRDTPPDDIMDAEISELNISAADGDMPVLLIDIS